MVNVTTLAVIFAKRILYLVVNPKVATFATWGSDVHRWLPMVGGVLFHYIVQIKSVVNYWVARFTPARAPNACICMLGSWLTSKRYAFKVRLSSYLLVSCMQWWILHCHNDECIWLHLHHSWHKSLSCIELIMLDHLFMGVFSTCAWDCTFRELNAQSS